MVTASVLNYQISVPTEFFAHFVAFGIFYVRFSPLELTNFSFKGFRQKIEWTSPPQKKTEFLTPRGKKQFLAKFWPKKWPRIFFTSRGKKFRFFLVDLSSLFFAETIWMRNLLALGVKNGRKKFQKQRNFRGNCYLRTWKKLFCPGQKIFCPGRWTGH